MADVAALHREMFDTVTSRDFDRLRGLYHADYVYMGADGVESKGADAGIAVAQGYTTAFPDLQFEIRRQYVPDESTSIVEFTGRGTHEGELQGIPATGRKVELVVCNVIEVSDGKILREREYFDALTMMRQLGVVE